VLLHPFAVLELLGGLEEGHLARKKSAVIIPECSPLEIPAQLAETLEKKATLTENVCERSNFL